MEPVRLTALINGQRYDTGMATLIADDAYWDGKSYERHGRNRFLFRTQLRGLYFVLTRSLLSGEEDEIDSLTREQAEALWEDLPRRNFTFEEAFPESVGARMASRGLVAEDRAEASDRMPRAAANGRFAAPVIETADSSVPASEARGQGSMGPGHDPEGSRLTLAAEDHSEPRTSHPVESPEAAAAPQPESNGVTATPLALEPAASQASTPEPSARRGRARPQRAKGSSSSSGRKSPSTPPRAATPADSPGREGTPASAAADLSEPEAVPPREGPAVPGASGEGPSDEIAIPKAEAADHAIPEPVLQDQNASAVEPATAVDDLPAAIDDSPSTGLQPRPPDGAIPDEPRPKGVVTPPEPEPSPGGAGDTQAETKEADLWLDDRGEWQAKGVVRHGGGRLRLIGNELHITTSGVSGRFRRSRWTRDEAIPLADVSQIGITWAEEGASLEIQFRSSGRQSMRLDHCRPRTTLEQLLDDAEGNGAGIIVRRTA